MSLGFAAALMHSFLARHLEVSFFVMKTEQTCLTWEHILSQGYRDIRDLRDYLQLSADEAERLAAIQETYPLFVNPYYLSLIRVHDSDDPIRRMCIPSEAEFDLAGFADTSGESSSTVLPGLQHKYPETALVLSTNQCAVYCRHCFRRRFVGVSHDETVRDIDEVAAYIKNHPEITNVLLSGGDVLMNSNETIRRYLEAFSNLDHVKTVRLASRMPVVLPQRITNDNELIGILEEVGKRKQLHAVTQFNHPAEITSESRAAVRELLHAGVPVRNQTVLLKGVNDDPATLVQLMDGLVGIGVAPYYVFQCRPTTGVKNQFQVPLQRGCQIVEQARMHLSGLAKSFRFIMSHDWGKIEILGSIDEGGMISASQTEAHPVLFKFHQARESECLGRIFSVDVDPELCWLDEAHLR